MRTRFPEIPAGRQVPAGRSRAPFLVRLAVTRSLSCLQAGIERLRSRVSKSLRQLARLPTAHDDAVGHVGSDVGLLAATVISSPRSAAPCSRISSNHHHTDRRRHAGVCQIATHLKCCPFSLLLLRTPETRSPDRAATATTRAWPSGRPTCDTPCDRSPLRAAAEGCEPNRRWALAHYRDRTQEPPPVQRNDGG